MNKRTAAAALSFSLISGTALGASVLGPWAAGAQSTTSTTAAQSAPAPVPTNPAVPSDLKADRTARLSEQLQSLVDAGTITAAQRDAVVAKLAEAGPMMGGFGGGHGHRGGFGLRAGSEALTKVLGLTETELRQKLAEGKSIAAIAAEKNIPVQTVIDALTTEANAKLAEAVTAGRLTQAQADERKADLAEHITAFVNGEMPTPRIGGDDGDGRRFGPGAPGAGTSGTTTSTTGA